MHSYPLIRWKILGTRLAINWEIIRYDTTLAPLDHRLFSQLLIAFCVWVYLHIFSYYLLRLWLSPLTRFHIPPCLLHFSSFLILILVCVFSERGARLTFVLLCNEQMPAVNVFLALCLWDSCQTQSKRGDTASHYFVADDQKCVPWRLKKEKQRHPFFLLLSLPLFITFSLICHYACFSSLLYRLFSASHLVLLEHTPHLSFMHSHLKLYPL